MILDKSADAVTIEDLIEFLDSLTSNWFLTSESCLEAIQSKEIWLQNHPIYIGIYCDLGKVRKILERLPSPIIWNIGGFPAEATFFLFCKVKLSIFLDYYGYIAEIRFNDLINRYKVLVYEPIIVTNGIKSMNIKSVTKKFNLLESADIYCKAMYGDGYLKIMQWDRWNSPKNIIWEDFIKKPKPIV